MGNYLPSPVTEKETENGSGSGVEYGVCSMQGWRSSMEDAHVARLGFGSPETKLFGVFDGHGGSRAAKFTATALPDQLLQSDMFKSGEIAVALEEAFMATDEAFWAESGHSPRDSSVDEKETVAEKIARTKARALSQAGAGPVDDDDDDSSPPPSFAWGSFDDDEEEDEESKEEKPFQPYSPKFRENSGTTAVVAVMQNDKIFCANAGDSRCVLGRGLQAVPLSDDHKPNNAGETKRIKKSGGTVEGGRVNGMLAVSRAIGDIDFKKSGKCSARKQAVTAFPDVLTIQLTPEDSFLFLACDGIWDCMTSQEAVDCILKELAVLDPDRPLSDVLAKLFDTIMCPRDPMRHEGLGCDNMTAVLVLLKPRSFFRPHPVTPACALADTDSPKPVGDKSSDTPAKNDKKASDTPAKNDKKANSKNNSKSKKSKAGSAPAPDKTCARVRTGPTPAAAEHEALYYCYRSAPVDYARLVKALKGL